MTLARSPHSPYIQQPAPAPAPEPRPVPQPAIRNALVKVSIPRNRFELPSMHPTVYYQKLLHHQLKQWVLDNTRLDDPEAIKDAATSIYPYIRALNNAFLSEIETAVVEAIEELARETDRMEGRTA